MHQPQHRIWWYPTGPLTFIPIHAAGPHKGTVNVTRIIISSYVTSLYSLFQAEKIKGPASIGRQKLLAVSQPQTLGHSPLPQSTHEVLSVIHAARSVGWSEDDVVHLHGLDATVERV